MNKIITLLVCLFICIGTTQSANIKTINTLEIPLNYFETEDIDSAYEDDESWFESWRKIYKNGGFKALIAEKGWVVGLVIFMFFLTKGLLWLLIPFLIAKGFFKWKNKS